MPLPVCLPPLLSLPPLRQIPFPRLLSASLHPIPFENPNLPSPPSLPALLSPSSGAHRGQRSLRRTVPCCSPMPASSTEERVLSPDCLSYERAFWVLRSLIAWNTGSDVASVFLYASWDAKLRLTDCGLEGEDVKVQLEWERCGLPNKVIEKFPHIKDYKAYAVPASVDFRKILKCQLAIASFRADGKCSDVTGLQLPGVLDDLFAYNGPLGAIFSKRSVTLNLWAPTAQVVHALLYKRPLAEDPFECIHLKDQDGVWCAVGPRSWEGCYYVYQVSVYHQSTLNVETYTVSDPYARGISSNGRRTLLVDLNSEDLKPLGWEELADGKPDLPSFSDISIYELHIRDFSENDQSVDPDFRGGYLAFTCQGIPFFHCGDDMLRSKSLDRDSYNSGDWFNRLDFSYQSNNWGVGLPPREKNEKNWPLIIPRLADSSFKPQKLQILAAVENFIELLKIRYSSQLFRLQTANAIQERVRFLNTGPSWVRGVIVMSIEDGYEGKPGMIQHDHNYSYIVIIFNACPTEVSVPVAALKRRALQLHPVQLESADNLVKRSSYQSSSGCFIVPQRTTAVFVEVRAN